MHIRSHETKGVSYRHVCSYCFQQNAKFFHMQSMTVETYFKKRVKRGGGTAASIQKFDTRYIYTSHVPFDKQELVVSKPVLTQWMKHANAFKKVTKNMSYAQALCTNSTVSASNLVQTVFGDIHKPHSATEAKTSPNMGIKTKLGILPGAPSLFVLPRISLKHDRIVKKVVRKVTHICNTEVCGGSVTKPKNETYKALTVNALPLSNRFQPLQYSPDTEQIKATSKYEDNTQLSSAFPSSGGDFLEQKAESLYSSRKLSRSQSDSLLQPKLATQANLTTLEGDKNKPGSFTEGYNVTTGRVGLHKQMASQVASTSLDSHKTIQTTGLSTKLKPQYTSPTVDSGHNTLNDFMPSKKDESYLVNSHQPVFGFLPTSPLQLYTGDPVYCETISDLIRAHRLIRQSGLPNYLKCRIPVQSGLNIVAWRSHLHGYWDSQICDLLQYGFPLDFDRSLPLLSSEVNHTSAVRSFQSVQEYLKEELQFQAILGPFHEKPIQLHVSPLIVRDKQNSSNKRTIMDLSWPHGASVNDGVHKDSYLQTSYELHYPSIDLITNSLRKLCPAKNYKVDISRAFRQIKVDPADIDLLGITFYQQYYIDRSMASNGFHTFFNYIDDLIYIGLPSEIQDSFEFLTKLLQQLGLDISTKKLVPPSTSVVCLGILIDSVNKTVSIPPDKLSQINVMCKKWDDKTYCGKKDLQSLLGSLLYITKCIKPARYFLNRMLHLTHYNGVTFYDKKYCHVELHLDVSLTGIGGVFKNMVYALPLPRGYNQYTIVHLEILNVVVTLKIWANHWCNQRIKIYCDNMAVVEVLRAGRARDQILVTCARNIWLICAIYNIDLLVAHIPGKENVLADLLSRWQFSDTNVASLNAILPDFQWVPTHLDLTLLNHTI